MTSGNMVTVVPTIGLGTSGTPLADEFAARVGMVVVDSRRMRPDMFEITFHDPDGTLLTAAGIEIGTPVTITEKRRLVVGEVTAIEGVYGRLRHTVVRGYGRDHRLQRARRSRTFTNMTDSDIARQVASGAGIEVGTITPTTVVHDHIGQVDQTDWEFLTGRAAEAGCDVGVRDGKFFFGTAATAPPVRLRFPDTLRAFQPRISAAGQNAKTELRVWDPAAATVVSSVVDTTAAGSATVTAPASLAKPFTVNGLRPMPEARGNPALGDLGPAPVAGNVRTGLPVGTGAAITAASAVTASAAAGVLGATSAEAIGEAVGDPALCAGGVVVVSGVAEIFCGQWVLTAARHVFGADGYRTDIEVSGTHQRTLLGLTTTRAADPLSGLVCGIVSNIADPLRLGRVKVTLPLLSPGYETDWAPIAQPGAGVRSGTVFGHEVGDQVLVGYECGDPRRPYVLGGIVSTRSTYTAGGEPVRTSAAASSLVWRGMVSPSGNRLAFHDVLVPRETTPTTSEVVVGTGKGDLALLIDAVAGTVTVRCAPETLPGRVIVECGAAGSVDVRAGAAGKVTIDGGAELALTAEALVKIQSTGPVEIKGNPIKLN